MSLTHRITRVLVYVGTADRIADAVARRAVKGTHILRDLVIHESVAGDCAEVLDDNDLPFSTIVLECAQTEGLNVEGQEPYEIFNGLLAFVKRREKYRLTTYVRNKAHAFQNEHLRVDPDTGTVEGRPEQLEYWNGLHELVEELGAL